MDIKNTPRGMLTNVNIGEKVYCQKGPELNSLSIHVTFNKIIIHIIFMCDKISLKRC